MPILQRRCRACDRRYELMSRGDEKWALEGDDLDHIGCPACGVTDEGEAMIGTQPRVGDHYPYYDKGLGAEVRDAGHRRWLLSHHADGTPRPQKLVPMEGEWDPEAQMDWQRNEDARVEAAYRRTHEEMTSGQNREAWGKLAEFTAQHGAGFWED